MEPTDRPVALKGPELPLTGMLGKTQAADWGLCCVQERWEL